MRYPRVDGSGSPFLGSPDAVTAGGVTVDGVSLPGVGVEGVPAELPPLPQAHRDSTNASASSRDKKLLHIHISPIRNTSYQSDPPAAIIYLPSFFGKKNLIGHLPFRVKTFCKNE